MLEEKKQVETVSNDFKREFERFAFLISENLNEINFGLNDGEKLSIELNELKIKFTGKKSDLAATKKLIGKIAPENRAEFGQFAQIIEREIVENIDEAETNLKEFIANAKIERDKIDVTLPSRRIETGSLHLITLLRTRIEDIFVSMGYAIEDDREIETDYYNFDALNIPAGHPARESQDTFYTTNGFALRSQTSTVQIRAMERRGAPIRIIAPGRVFRRDTPDMTHVPMFHQVEGLCVDRNITMAHLKGTIGEFVRRLFGENTIIRMRPSYFPFTEPSAEFDYSCFKCNGTGVYEDLRCRPCKGSGWIELGGSGMVHPNVLQNCGVDPEVFSGFAFGFGLERMCALAYALDDIRLMFENDVRFLSQFK